MSSCANVFLWGKVRKVGGDPLFLYHEQYPMGFLQYEYHTIAKEHCDADNIHCITNDTMEEKVAYDLVVSPHFKDLPENVQRQINGFSDFPMSVQMLKDAGFVDVVTPWIQENELYGLSVRNRTHPISSDVWLLALKDLLEYMQSQPQKFDPSTVAQAQEDARQALNKVKFVSDDSCFHPYNYQTSKEARFESGELYICSQGFQSKIFLEETDNRMAFIYHLVQFALTGSTSEAYTKLFEVFKSH